jgi:glycerophosphoryl diester phosphodiesterase
MFPIQVPHDFRIIAHRGASGYAPENTFPAFDLARQMGAVEIETDTQLTTDGTVVLCHDLSLDRLGHPGVVVESSSIDDLRPLDLGSWFSPHLYGGTTIVTLAELFARYGDSFIYHAELKGKAENLPDAMRDVIRNAGMEERCIITSFDYQHLARMRKIDSDCRLGWLVGEVGEEECAQARKIDLLQLCPRAGSVTDEMVARSRTIVEEVRAWGLGGSGQQVAELIHRLLAAGCDGATVNWPDWITRS